MAEANITPAPFDMEKLGQMLDDKIKAAVGAAVTPLQTEIAEFRKTAAAPAAPAKPADDGKPKAVTMADIEKLLDTKLQAQTQSAQTEQARKAYAGTKLHDLPEIYREQLGADPAKFDEQAQAIRTRYQADFKLTGQKVPNVSGTPAGGAGGNPVASQGGAVDLSKQSATSLIQMGLQEDAAAKAAGK